MPGEDDDLFEPKISDWGRLRVAVHYSTPAYPTKAELDELTRAAAEPDN